MARSLHRKANRGLIHEELAKQLKENKYLSILEQVKLELHLSSLKLCLSISATLNNQSLPLNLCLSSSSTIPVYTRTLTLSSALILVVMMRSKEIKTSRLVVMLIL